MRSLGCFVLVAATSAATAACGRVAPDGDERPSTSVQYGTVALGETCGQRGAASDSPLVLECVSGSCGHSHVGSEDVDGGFFRRNAYGVCVMPCGAAVAADAGSCPTGFDCFSEAVCRRPCSTDAECPGPYQMCASDGHCDVRVCTGDAECPSARCVDGVCVR